MFECDTTCPRCGHGFESQDIGEGNCPSCGLPYYQEHECWDDFCSNDITWEKFTATPECYDPKTHECSTLDIHRCPVCCSKDVRIDHEQRDSIAQTIHLIIRCEECQAKRPEIRMHFGMSDVSLKPGPYHMARGILIGMWNKHVHFAAYPTQLKDNWDGPVVETREATMAKGHPFYRGEVKV